MRYDKWLEYTKPKQSKHSRSVIAAIIVGDDICPFNQLIIMETNWLLNSVHISKKYIQYSNLMQDHTLWGSLYFGHV